MNFIIFSDDFIFMRKKIELFLKKLSEYEKKVLEDRIDKRKLGTMRNKIIFNSCIH